MPWPSFPSETTGTGSRFQGTDLNEARKYNAVWEAKTLSAAAIIVSGDGKYRVSYTGAQNLATITGSSSGDRMVICANVTAAGGNLTVQHNVGNIRLNLGIDIVLKSNDEWIELIHMPSGFICGGLVYGEA